MANPKVPTLMFLHVGISAALNVIDMGAASIAKKLPMQNQDAFFFSPPTGSGAFVGVFDGVSSGPESRPFAQALAKSSREVLTADAKCEWPKAVNNALTAGTKAAKGYNGAATAMLMKVNSGKANIYSLGDCITILVRPSVLPWKKDQFEVAQVTTEKIHPENGAPYQFGGKKLMSDAIVDGQDFTFSLKSGDVLLSYSDGVADNIASEGVAELVRLNYGESAEEIARTLVEAARMRNAVDDDATAVVVKCGDGAWEGGALEATETPSDLGAVQQFAKGFIKNWQDYS